MTPHQSRRLRAIISRAAEEELLTRFNRVTSDFKADGSVVTQADLAMQKRIRDELSGLFPQYGFLAEEMDSKHQERQLEYAAQGLWILDPLDGTSNYAMGIPYFAVSLALIQDRNLQFAMVYDPSRRELFHAKAGEGAWLNDQRLGTTPPPTPLAKGIGLVDLKRLPKELAQRLADSPPYASQRSFGSVALDLCWVAAGRVHVYLHGRHNLWDYAAGHLILRESGGHFVTLQGEKTTPLDTQPRSTAAALDRSLFREWCAWLEI